jgi:hypothetical protein
MNIARIDRLTDAIINIEVADQDWIDANTSDPDYRFVPYVNERVIIGGQHNPVTGEFSDPIGLIAAALPPIPVSDEDFLNVDDGIEVQP